MPVVNGSVLYAVLTAVGLACVCGARCAKLLEPKEVGMSLVFVVTAGVCMWLVYLATWMVSGVARGVCCFSPMVFGAR
jgi:hypothetical protein